MSRANFGVFKLDQYGYLAFAHPALGTHEEAAERAAEIPGALVADLAEYYRRADPDKLSEARVRAMTGGGPAPCARVAVVTGVFPGVPREEVTRRVKAAGYRIAASVTGATTALVAGDGAGPAKVKAAKARGIPVLSLGEIAR